MNKIFMLTRGRTGSSAILDELGTTSIYAPQELFADFSGALMEGTLKEYTQFAPPFDVWKAIFLGKGKQTWKEMFVVQKESMDDPDRLLYTLIRILNKTAPFLLSNNRLMGRKIERILIERYLNSIEGQAADNNKTGIIFKVLSPNLMARKSLLGVLKDRGYRSLFLVRKNVVRHVLSILLAHYRSQAEGKNMYYKRGHVGELASLAINLDEFERRVELEQRCVSEDRSLLTKSGIDYLEVTYEDFCDDREKFYSEIFSFMGVEYELPKNTDLSIMVPDIRKAVANFDELEARVTAMGMKDLL